MGVAGQDPYHLMVNTCSQVADCCEAAAIESTLLISAGDGHERDRALYLPALSTCGPASGSEAADTASSSPAAHLTRRDCGGRPRLLALA